MSDVIHQVVTLPASPARVYAALMDSAEHSAFTAGEAVISPEVGGAFTAHTGGVEGRNVELVPGERIVQAWRLTNWPAGVWSLVRFALEADGDSTKLTMDHVGVPVDFIGPITEGWRVRYWTPLATHLAG